MQKKLFKIITSIIAVIAFVGCGSSGSSKTTPASEQGQGQGQGQEQQVNPRTCVYSTPKDQTLTVGDAFDPATMVATAKSGTGEDITTVTVKGADDVNTSTAGTYDITFESVDCDNKGKTTITVKEADKPKDDGSNPLPF